MGDARLFDMEAAPVANPNPCVALYGPGPTGEKCGSCARLLRRGAGHSKNWYKCPLRRSTRDTRRLGAASTDQRVRWDACGQWVDEIPPLEF